MHAVSFPEALKRDCKYRSFSILRKSLTSWKVLVLAINLESNDTMFLYISSSICRENRSLREIMRK